MNKPSIVPRSCTDLFFCILFVLFWGVFEDEKFFGSLQKTKKSFCLWSTFPRLYSKVILLQTPHAVQLHS